MSLSRFVENLQNKPRPVRVLILWVSVAATMTIVLGFWFVSFNSRIQGNRQKTEVAQDQTGGQLQEIKKDIPTVWQTLKAGISGIFENVLKEEEKNSEIETETPSVEFEGNDLQDHYYNMLP